jgi:rhodanese-related sulfurtransferase
MTVMPTSIEREAVQRMVGAGAHLLDVRSAEDFAAEHLPGASSLPLKELDRGSAAQFDRDRPVITYCWDRQ